MGLEEVLEVLVTDGRRPSNQVSLEQVKGYWGRAFSKVSSEVLHKAVEKWLLENKRGWPRVAEIMELIKLQEPAKQAPELLSERQEAQKRHEVGWAISILEDPGRYEGESYRHTLETAEHYLRRHGFNTWRDAKSWLVPGWATPIQEYRLASRGPARGTSQAPSTVTEVYL